MVGARDVNVEKKSDEVTVIKMADAVVQPGTMMI
jgi:hypothetical protein